MMSNVCCFLFQRGRSKKSILSHCEKEFHCFFLCCFNISIICFKKVSRKHIGPLFPVSKRRFQKRQYWPSVSLFKASTGSSLSNNVLPVRHPPVHQKNVFSFGENYFSGVCKALKPSLDFHTVFPIFHVIEIKIPTTNTEISSYSF